MSAREDQNNRSNQMNPNNRAYWISRGYSDRPADYANVSLQQKADGQLESRANNLGHISDSQRKAMGSDIRKIESAAKAVYGGDAKIRKGGSIYKKDNTPKSDLDLKIEVDTPATDDQRRQFQQEIGKHFSVSGKVVDIVHGSSGDIDVMPSKADNFPKDFELDKMGVEPFKTNHVGRDAVRLVKDDFSKYGKKIKGKEVEDAVLNIQQKNKGINRADLVHDVEIQLGLLSYNISK